MDSPGFRQRQNKQASKFFRLPSLYALFSDLFFRAHRKLSAFWKKNGAAASPLPVPLPTFSLSAFARLAKDAYSCPNPGTISPISLEVPFNARHYFHSDGDVYKCCVHLLLVLRMDRYSFLYLEIFGHRIGEKLWSPYLGKKSARFLAKMAYQPLELAAVDCVLSIAGKNKESTPFYFPYNFFYWHLAWFWVEVFLGWHIARHRNLIFFRPETPAPRRR